MTGRGVLVLGGAGFIGSHVVRRFVELGDRVTVVDGLLPETGGAARNLAAVADAIDWRRTAVEDTAELQSLVSSAAVVVDCMAWTRHLAAFGNPRYDLRLNLESHLRLIECLHSAAAPLVIYLGSCSQYGRVTEGRISETTPMVPEDVQSVHKSAADHQFRIHAARRGLNVVSLRLPNCFGEHQPVAGDDIGLVGGFIRTLLQGQAVTVYGSGRKRSLLYVRDAAEIIARVSGAAVSGFTPLNVSAEQIGLDALATELAALCGRGSVAHAPMPREIALIDTGEAPVDDGRLRSLIGPGPRTGLSTALRATVDYFNEGGR